MGPRTALLRPEAFLAGYRYHLNHWLSAEAVYGWDRNTQKYLLGATE
jgi:hypothetical protein